MCVLCGVCALSLRCEVCFGASLFKFEFWTSYSTMNVWTLIRSLFCFATPITALAIVIFIAGTPKYKIKPPQGSVVATAVKVRV